MPDLSGEYVTTDFVGCGRGVSKGSLVAWWPSPLHPGQGNAESLCSQLKMD